MLYISRWIGAAKYGVVDTDDENEDIVEWEDLRRACCELGLEIKGVETFHEFGQCHIETVTPYQPKETVSLHQIKTSVLSHVNITVFRDFITTIKWYQNDIKSPVVIRLYDFGKILGDYCFLCCEFCNEHVVTVVLNDELEFSGRSFYVYKPLYIGVEGIGAKFDLREISDDMKAEIVYKCVFDCPNGVDPFDSIIDKPGRLKYFRDAYERR